MICFHVCLECSRRSSKQTRLLNCKRCFRLCGFCSTQATKNFTTSWCAINPYMACLGFWNVFKWLYLDDANFRTKRPRHRDFVKSNSRLLEVVPFNNHHELLNLIVFTFRLEYVRECILFPYLDDNGFSSSGCVSPCNNSDHTQQLQKNFQPYLQSQAQRLHKLTLWSAKTSESSRLQLFKRTFSYRSYSLCRSFYT